ncbi:MAG: T9SS type A sorting domain-containing protein [Flavobacteriales bacterium]
MKAVIVGILYAAAPWSRNAVLLVCSIFIGGSQAQYYKPFTATTKKLFSQYPSPGNGYSLSFDSAAVDGTDSVYYHFGALDVGSTYEDPNCSGWGPPYCYRTDQPIWPGSFFRTDNMGAYRFGNVEGDTLQFNFGASSGDTSTFFVDAVQRFSFVKSGPDTMTILGYTDSVYTYVIQHTDLAGAPIASALQGDSVIVGKALGLVRFFRVDSFPQVLQPLAMLGNLDPPLGLYRITTAMIEDHQPGDVVQFKTYTGSTLPNGQPFTYHTTTFLSRTDTPDSVFYDVAWENFNITTGAHNSGTGVAGYSKNEVYAELPFEKFDGSFNTFMLSGPGSCLPTWRLYRHDEPGLGLCPDGNCWVAADTQGPPPSSYGSVLLGLGITSYFYQDPFSPWDPYYFEIRDLVYFIKDGVECGQEIHLGISENNMQVRIELLPNPTKGNFVITSSDRMDRIDILNARGQVVLHAEPRADQVELGLADVPSGPYFASIYLMDGSIAHRKVIVAR